MEIQAESFEEKYLGLPTLDGRMNRGKFQNLQSRLLKRIIAWGDTLSLAGKETMIKAIAQAIPTYSMTCFKLTKKVYKGFSSKMARYWWSSSVDCRSLHWIDWDSLTKPKIAGGMGFRNLEMFNLALLGKHGWMLITKPEYLCARVLKGKYFPAGEFMDAAIPKLASATWSPIVVGREALQMGLIKRVGDGTSVSTWNDSWIPGLLTLRPSVQIGDAMIPRVANLINADQGTWNSELVRHNFIAPKADAILNIPLSFEGGDDSWAWAA